MVITNNNENNVKEDRNLVMNSSSSSSADLHIYSHPSLSSSDSILLSSTSSSSCNVSTSNTSITGSARQENRLKIGHPTKLNVLPNPRSRRPAEISQWKFAQCFGDKSDTLEVAEADIISTVQFDKTGKYLASGDHAGRVVLFQRNERKKTGGCEYKFWSEFQSHEPEFDYLKSLEINEKINKIVFCPSFSEKSLQILTCNDKTIKLWKVGEKSFPSAGSGGASYSSPSSTNSSASIHSTNTTTNTTELKLPTIKRKSNGSSGAVSSAPRHIYSNAHTYHIHSIAMSADDECFLSADDLRINLWHLERPRQSWTMIDLKPDAIEDLTEVLTVSQFHPSEPHLLGYATSKGNVNLCDMRLSSDFRHSSISSSATAAGSSGSGSNTRQPRQSFFSELITSISDLKFSPCGRMMATRDYMSLKVWDLSMLSRGPLEVVAVHDSIKSSLCDLYENDQIFDKFECEWGADSGSILSGSYGNLVRVCNLNDRIEKRIGFGCAGGNLGQLQSTRSKDVVGAHYPLFGGDDLIHADKSLFRNHGAINASLSTFHQSSSPSTSVKRTLYGSGGGGGSPSATPLSSMLGTMDQTEEQSTLDWDRKIMHLTHHPKEPTVAIASLCNLFIFSQI